MGCRTDPILHFDSQHWAQVRLDHCMVAAHVLAAAPAGHNLPAAWPMWGDLAAEIEGFFLPGNNREWARAQLLRLRQGPCQRIDEFLAQFEALKVQSGCLDEYARDLLKRAVSWKILEQVYLQAVTRGPLITSRAPICHHPLPHLAAACQWTSAPQTHTPNLVGGGYNAIIVRGSAISHVSAHSHADPGNNSKPGPHSIKEATLMTKESMLCVGCPLQKCGTFSRI